MKYTKEQRLDIGRRIYDGEIDCYQAAEEYSINHYTARDYMRLYRDTYQLPKRSAATHTCKSVSTPLAANSQASLQDKCCRKRTTLFCKRGCGIYYQAF